MPSGIHDPFGGTVGSLMWPGDIPAGGDLILTSVTPAPAHS